MSSHLLLNTQNAIFNQGTPDDCSWSLNIPAIDKNITISLERAIIPNLRFPVNSLNNNLAITYNTGANTNYTVTITPGYYNSTTFASQLQSQLRTATSNASLTVTFSTSTYYLTIATNNTDTIAILSTSTCALLMGLALPVAAATSITGTYPIRLDGSMYVDLCTTSFSAQSYSSGGSTYNVIARIPLTVGFGSVNYYEDYTTASRFNIQYRHLKNIRLFLIDDAGYRYILPVNQNCVFSFLISDMLTLGGLGGGIGTASNFGVPKSSAIHLPGFTSGAPPAVIHR